ncbi:MAG: hypothetical protein ACOX3E_08140 [Desulfomonilia bacterium]
MSLVDPDNRRPVDYQLRRDLLGRISGMKPRQIVREMESGLPKLWTINRALELRRRFPRAFGDRSSYRPWRSPARRLNTPWVSSGTRQ